MPCSVIEEFLTGRGTLQQIGFSTPNQSLLGAILLIFGGATLIGTVSTLTKATGGKLSLKCVCIPRSLSLNYPTVHEHGGHARFGGRCFGALHAISDGDCLPLLQLMCRPMGFSPE